MTALERLYDWFNEQLSRASVEGGRSANAAAAPQSSPNVANRQKLFVKEQVENLLEKIGARARESDRVVTVRRRAGDTHKYLRPVYAEPNELNEFLSEFSRQIPFSVKYNGDSNAFFGTIQKEWRNLDGDVFLCIHRVGKNIEGIATDEAETIAERLTKFWHDNLKRSQIRAEPSHDGLLDPTEEGAESSKFSSATMLKAYGVRGAGFLERVNELNARQSPKQELFCVFAGKFAPEKDGKLERQLSALCGVYLVQPTSWSPDQAEVMEALQHARDLFRGLEIISQLDSKLFELKGLRVMAELLPKFVDEESPRSDKISLALSGLRGLLDRHLVGRPEWEGAEQPKLFYLSASFERKEKKEWLPRLEVYPHAYRYEFPLVSLLVSHVRVPSTSKFLLKTYLEKHWKSFSTVKEGDRLDPAFVSIFSADKLNIPPASKWKNHVIRGQEKTCLTMVEHDEFMEEVSANPRRNKPWDKLNHSASSTGDPSRSLLAFVIEGEVVQGKRAFPRGILALESGAIDAFSEYDIDALREVIRAFGSLVRLITHDNACLDYRMKLSQAFDADLYNITRNEKDQNFALIRKFVFSVRKVDGQRFRLLLTGAIPNHGSHVWDLLGLSYEERETLYGFIPHIKGVPNSAVEGQAKANEIVAKRVNWALKRADEEYHNLGQTGRKLTDGVVEFLFACTENFQWSAYLSSLAQVLGDRATNMIPEFQLMTPGYSASRIFMASVTRELRQVVKLSEYKKLNEERKRYRTYVRYRLVNAARMPVNGFTYDGTGWLNRRKPTGKRKDGYGALVSDLISVTEANEHQPIRTFSRLLYQCVVENPGRSQHMQILKGIHALFENGMTLWREEAMPSWVKNVSELMRSASRLPKISQNFPEKHEDFDEQRKRIGALHEALEFYTCICGGPEPSKEILHLLFSRPTLPLPGDQFSKDIYQISHRDLNAKNVTWSGALSTFLMIDFEHVGHGYLGSDQIRLWVNSICDLYAEENDRGPSQILIKKVLDAIEVLIKRTEELFVHLKTRGLKDSSIKEYVKKYLTGDGHPENIKLVNEARQRGAKNADYFPTFFVSLFYNFKTIDAQDGMILYGFYCHILKEFEYSSKDLELDKVREIGALLPALDKATSKRIHEVLQELHEGFPTEPIKSLYFRHFIAARLLTIVVKAMRT